MGKTTPCRNALKKRFTPYAEMRGFVVEKPSHSLFSTFTRRVNDVAHVFDIQWEKNGAPRFIVNFGMSSLSNFSEEKKLDVYQNIACHNADTWGRLYPRKGMETGNWFRYDLPLFKRLLYLRPYRQPDEVVDELMRIFPEVEAWWNSEIVGPHMRILRSNRTAAGTNPRSDAETS